MPETLHLYTMQEEVHDETTFLKFAEALLNDWIDECQKEAVHRSPVGSPGANGWQNGDITSFLEAAIAWGTSHSMFTEDDINPWQKFAVFLHAGKFYE